MTEKGLEYGPSLVVQSGGPAANLRLEYLRNTQYTDVFVTMASKLLHFLHILLIITVHFCFKRMF